jgi:hypothetical protein
MTELEKLKKRWTELLNSRPLNEAGLIEQEQVSQKMKLEWAKLQIELVSELKEKGNSIKTIWDLVNTKATYPVGTVEVLIKHMDIDYHNTIKEGIVRALMVKEAWGIAVPSLIREYEKTPESKFDFRWIIGCAIGYLMTKEHIDWVITTVLDKSNGRSRSGMLVPLVRIKSEKAEAVLLELLDEENPDPGVVYQAIEGLGKLKSQLAKEKLQTFLNHPNKEFRKDAEKALLKIG